MQQVSWRADVDLVVRVKRAAAQGGYSLNEYMTLVLDVATDPARASDVHTSLRERLQLAGLLASVEPVTGLAPEHDDVMAAGRLLADGVSLSDVVVAQRR